MLSEISGDPHRVKRIGRVAIPTDSRESKANTLFGSRRLPSLSATIGRTAAQLAALNTKRLNPTAGRSASVGGKEGKMTTHCLVNDCLFCRIKLTKKYLKVRLDFQLIVNVVVATLLAVASGEIYISLGFILSFHLISFHLFRSFISPVARGPYILSSYSIRV